MARRNQVDIQIRATDAASKTIGKVRKELTGLGGAGKLARAGLIGVAGGAVALTAAAAGAAAAGTNMAASYEEGLANVNTLLGGNTTRIQELGSNVKALSVATGKPLSDLTDGLYQVVSAFGDSADTAKDLEIAVHAARAGVASTTDAINLISAVTKGYGDTSAEAQKHVSDLATLTVKMGQTTFPELAQSIGRVTPLSQALGVSQEELFAVMATGTGVTGNAAEVSTQLRGVLQGLMAPTSTLQGLYDKLGVSGGKALIEQQGLEGAIQTVIQASKDSGVPLQKYIQQIEGQTLALTLAGSQSDVYAQKLDELGNAAGATDKAFNIQQDTVNALRAQITQAAKVILIDVGEKLLPLLKDFLQWVVAHLPEIMATVERVFDGIGTALTIAGKVITTVMGIFKSQTQDGSSATNAALQTLTIAWTDARDLVKAVIDVLVALWTHVLKPTWTAIGPTVRDIFKIVGDVLHTAVGTITQILEALTAFLNGDFTGAWDHMKGAVTTLVGGLAKAIETIFHGLIESLKNIGKLLLEGLVAGIKGAMQTAKAAVQDVGDNVIGWFKDKLGIHSPSAVFAGFGRDLLRGLAVGLVDPQQLQATQDAAQKAAEAVIQAAKVALGLEAPPNPWKAYGHAILDGIKAGIEEQLPGFTTWLAGKLAASNYIPNLTTPSGGSSPDVYVPKLLGPGYDSPRAIPNPNARASLPPAVSLPHVGGSQVVIYAPNLREPGDLTKSASYVPGLLGTGYDSRRIGPPAATATAGPAIALHPPSSTVAIGSGVGTDPGALNRYVFGNTQDNGSVGPAAQTTTGALKVFGDSLLGLAKDKIPLVGTALQGLAEGGPIGAVAAVFTDLLSRTQAFQDLIQLVTTAIQPVVEALGQVLQAVMPIIKPLLDLNAALTPIIQVVAAILTPVFKALGTVIGWLSDIVTAIVNAFVDVYNFLLGWLLGSIDHVKTTADRLAEEQKKQAEAQKTAPTPTTTTTSSSINVGTSAPGVQLAAASFLVDLKPTVHAFGGYVGDFGTFVTRLVENGIQVRTSSGSSPRAQTASLTGYLR